MQKRYDLAMELVVSLSGIVSETVYSPIVYYHVIANRYELPKDFEYWQTKNFSELSRCNYMIVAGIPGWKESVGLRHEYAFARQVLSIPVFLLTPTYSVLILEKCGETEGGLVNLELEPLTAFPVLS